MKANNQSVEVKDIRVYECGRTEVVEETDDTYRIRISGSIERMIINKTELDSLKCILDRIYK